MAWYDTWTLAQASETPATPGSISGGETPGVTNTGSATTTTTGTGEQALPPRGSGGGYELLFMVTGIIVLMYLMVVLPQRKEKKRREALMNELKKGDRILTIGGIMGVVQSVKDKEVVVKVDESNNTCIRFTRAAIQGIVDADTKEMVGAK